MKLTSHINRSEIFRFVVIGLLSTAFYGAVLYSLIPALPLAPASIGAYLAALGLNYWMQRTWTFRSGRRHREAAPRFVVIHIGGMVLNALILHVLSDRLGLHLLPTQFAAFAVIAAWSFTCQKVWVFAER